MPLLLACLFSSAAFGFTAMVVEERHVRRLLVCSAAAGFLALEALLWWWTS
jgi:hypothetical protein